MTPLRFFDVIVIAVAAPIMLLIHVPAFGYLLGAGAWIALRVAGVGMERVAAGAKDASQQITIRMVFMMSRLFLLALAVILARHHSKHDGLAALIVIAAAFTLSMALMPLNRPTKRNR